MIKVARPEDFEIVKDLLEKLMKDSVYSAMFEGYELSQAEFDLYMNNPKDKFCVLSIDEEGNAIGIGVFDILPWLYSDLPTRIARLSYIYVSPEHRSKGLGKEINEAFEYWGKAVKADWYSKGNSGKNDGYQKVEVIYMKKV